MTESSPMRDWWRPNEDCGESLEDVLEQRQRLIDDITKIYDDVVERLWKYILKWQIVAGVSCAFLVLSLLANVWFAWQLVGGGL